ncbi:MAG: ATP-binding protein [Chitinophagales bacterium]
MELSQLFQNLISNAIKYRKKETPPLIEIKVVSKPNSFEYSVRDNGIGIASKHTKRIFQMFQRLHARNAYEGIGIGLAHCKRIDELHSGQIWVESEEGIGSIFFFTIHTNTEL